MDMALLEISFLVSMALLTIFFCLWFYRNINGLPWNWLLVGMLPSLFCHIHRVHDRCVDLLHMVGGTFLLKGPWFASMDILITADPANVHFIMSANFADFPKGHNFKKIFDVLGDGIFNSDSETWSHQRKQARALLTHDSFLRFLGRVSMQKVEQGLVPVLEHVSENGLVVDLQDLFQRFTFDTTCMLVTGFDPGCLSAELPDVPFSRAMDEVEEALFMRHCLPETVWKFQKWLDVGHERRMRRAWAVLDGVIEEYISVKRKDEMTDDYDDLLTSYIKGCNDDRFLRDTVLNLMIAGRDTTSSALTWFMWLVTTHPEVEKKIRDELMSSSSVRATEEHPRMFGVEEVRGLVYLQAALCEALRLYPPVPFQHKEAVRGVVVPSGHEVGPGMKVMVSLYAMGRMEYIWGEDAAEFKPERWISERGSIKYEPSYKFLAFNAGPRSCLGKQVAFTQLKCVAAAMLHNYRVDIVKGNPVSPNVSVILYMKHGFKVKVARRA